MTIAPSQPDRLGLESSDSAMMPAVNQRVDRTNFELPRSTAPETASSIAGSVKSDNPLRFPRPSNAASSTSGPAAAKPNADIPARGIARATTTRHTSLRVSTETAATAAITKNDATFTISFVATEGVRPAMTNSVKKATMGVPIARGKRPNRPMTNGANSAITIAVG